MYVNLNHNMNYNFDTVLGPFTSFENLFSQQCYLLKMRLELSVSRTHLKEEAFSWIFNLCSYLCCINRAPASGDIYGYYDKKAYVYRRLFI